MFCSRESTNYLRYAAAKDGKSSGTAFSMVKNVDTPSAGTTAETGKLISKIDSIELSLHALNNKDPYKPRVSPQWNRPFHCNPCQFQNDRRSGQSFSQNPNSYDSNRYQGNRRGQANFNNHRKGRFHASSNVRCPRVASRTPGKDITSDTTVMK